MREITHREFQNALAFLKNRHKVTVSRSRRVPRITVDGQALSREDAVRMAESEGWSDSWKPL